MKRLYLLRHAKAVSDDGTGDHERPLMERGRADARRAGQIMAARSFAPSLVLCSTAARTVETKDLVLAELPVQPAVKLDRSLYLAPAASLWRIVTQIDASADSAMLIGHNPGLEELALQLAGRDKLAARIDEKFPTCALAVFDSPSSTGVEKAWRLLDVIYPADD